MSAHVSQFFAPRDALLGHQTFEYQLARRHDRGGILLAGNPDLINQVEQSWDHGKALQQRLGALFRRDLEPAALVEPVDDVVDVRPAHGSLAWSACASPDQI